MISDYQEAWDWLLSLLHCGIKLGLHQTRRLAELCGSPEQGLRFIHLAGTNGKGSTGAMLERALRENNFKTGFFSSPHLISACERIRINGRAVSDADFAAAAEKVKAAVEVMHKEDMHPTYFEALTVIGLLVFKQHQCDYIVWETGMGGRLDSTNIVDPVMSVITNIALDHEKYLGSTLAAIAGEKAGIIKLHRPVVVGQMAEEAETVIRAKAVEMQSEFTRAADIAPLEKTFSDVMQPNCQRFQCAGEVIELKLNGLMQQRNAQLVIAVLKKLDLWNAESRRGLSFARWPARIELLQDGRFLLDGGHNPDGIRSLAETLVKLYPGKKFDFVFGAFADKDYTGGLEIIAPLMRSLTAVSFAEEARISADAGELCRSAAALGVPKVGIADSLAEHLRRTAAEPDPEGVPTVIAGSLYLAGEVLNILSPRERVLDL